MNCCRGAVSAAYLEVTQIIGSYLQALLGITGAADGSVMALVPGATVGTSRLVIGSAAAFTGPAAVATGAVVILEAYEVAHLATETSAILSATGLADAIGQAVALRDQPPNDSSDDRCFICMSRSTLSQDHPRKTLALKVRKRL